MFEKWDLLLAEAGKLEIKRTREPERRPRQAIVSLPERFDVRKTGETALRKWARAVRARDMVCQDCGATEHLAAHHIKPKAQHPELAHELSNGVLLCVAHHRARHPELPDRMFKVAA